MSINTLTYLYLGIYDTLDVILVSRVKLSNAKLGYFLIWLCPGGQVNKMSLNCWVFMVIFAERFFKSCF